MRLSFRNTCVSHAVTYVSLEQISQMIEQLQHAAAAATEKAAEAAAAADSAAVERDRLEQEKKNLVQAAEEAHTAERLALEQAAAAVAAAATAEKRLGESEERRVAFEEDVRRQEAVGERERDRGVGERKDVCVYMYICILLRAYTRKRARTHARLQCVYMHVYVFMRSIIVRVVCAYVTEVSRMVVCVFSDAGCGVLRAQNRQQHMCLSCCNICVSPAVTYVSLMPQAAEHYEHKVDEEQRAFLQDKIR